MQNIYGIVHVCGECIYEYKTLKDARIALKNETYKDGFDVPRNEVYIAKWNDVCGWRALDRRKANN